MKKLYLKLEYQDETIEIVTDNEHSLENYLFRVYGLSFTDPRLFLNKNPKLKSHVTDKIYFPIVYWIDYV